MRRTAEDAAQTRTSLLASALECFAEYGWQGATFTQVAKRAGVTRGAIYHHFRSKLELLTEALGWGWQKYSQQLFDQHRESCKAYLTVFISEYIQLLRDDPTFRALATTTVHVAPLAASYSEIKHDALDEWRTHFIEVFSTSTGKLPAECTAGLLMSILHGLTITAVTRSEDLPLPEHHDLAVEALVKGLME